MATPDVTNVLRQFNIELKQKPDGGYECQIADMATLVQQMINSALQSNGVKADVTVSKDGKLTVGLDGEHQKAVLQQATSAMISVVASTEGTVHKAEEKPAQAAAAPDREVKKAPKDILEFLNDVTKDTVRRNKPMEKGITWKSSGNVLVPVEDFQSDMDAITAHLNINKALIEKDLNLVTEISKRVISLDKATVEMEFLRQFETSTPLQENQPGREVKTDDKPEPKDTAALLDELTTEVGVTWKGSLTSPSSLISVQRWGFEGLEFISTKHKINRLLATNKFNLEVQSEQTKTGKFWLKIDINKVGSEFAKRYETPQNVETLKALDQITKAYGFQWVIIGNFLVNNSYEFAIDDEVHKSEIKVSIEQAIRGNSLGQPKFMVMKKNNGRYAPAIDAQELFILLKVKEKLLALRNHTEPQGIDWQSKDRSIFTAEKWRDMQQALSSVTARALKQLFGDDCLAKFKAVERSCPAGETPYISLGFDWTDCDKIVFAKLQ